MARSALERPSASLTEARSFSSRSAIMVLGAVDRGWGQARAETQRPQRAG
jgi:hypothetical protein